jgi:hypothetical protein
MISREMKYKIRAHTIMLIEWVAFVGSIWLTYEYESGLPILLSYVLLIR